MGEVGVSYVHFIDILTHIKHIFFRVWMDRLLLISNAGLMKYSFFMQRSDAWMIQN